MEQGYTQRQAAKLSGVAQAKLSRLKKRGIIAPDLPDEKYSAELIDKIRAEYGTLEQTSETPSESAGETIDPVDEQTPADSENTDKEPVNENHEDDAPQPNTTDTENFDAPIVSENDSKEIAPAALEEISATRNENGTITIKVPFKLVTLDERAARIRKLSTDVTRGIIEIGKELIAAKAEIKFGEWSEWLKTEFDWTQRTANNFMRVAERFGKMETGFQFKPSTLIQLLALPEGEEQEFIDEQAEKGKPVEEMTKREVQSAVKEFNRQRDEELNTLANIGDSNAEYGGALENENTNSGITPKAVEIPAAGKFSAPAESPTSDEQGETDDENKSNAAGDEWFTPSEYIEAARRVFGGTIDLDPASCEKANEIVKATKIYTKENSGLNEYWEGNVWMNPPYSKGLIDQFVDKIIYSGGVTAAIVLTDNKTETKWFLELAQWSSAMIFTVGRVNFLHDGKLEKGNHRRGQAIFYIGDEPQKFLDEFQKFGWTAKFVAPPTE